MATKLLLIEDVEHLGRSGDLVTVKPGYARNLLIPSRKAVVADKRTLRLQAQLQEKRRQIAITDRKDSEELAARLAGQTVRTVVKVDHAGHMYGSVSTGDIVDLLQAQHGIVIEKRSIQLKHPIKEIGVTDIVMKLKEGVVAQFHLKVLAEGAEEETVEATTESAPSA
jgi:large subunit ribosomal protein L9